MIPRGDYPQPVHPVNASRLQSGKWIGERLVNEGDICRSYSADRISENKPVRAPFHWQGSLWICVGMFGRGEVWAEASAYRLIPIKLFDGEPISYGQRCASDDLREAARQNPMGFYHAMVVRHEGEQFVLCGPEGTFVPGAAEEPSSAVQLGLF